MSVEFFLDTNILAYAFDRSDQAKRERSSALVREALAGSGCVSWQVIQEFCNIALKKFKKPLGIDELREYQEIVLFPLCAVWPNDALYREALTVKLETGFSWYDSLITVSALRAGCGILYSEDLRNGREYRGMRILNPFK